MENCKIVCIILNILVKTHYFRGHILSKHEDKRLYSYCKICGKKTSNMEYHMRTYHMEEFLRETKIENSLTPIMSENIHPTFNSNQENNSLNLHFEKQN